MVKEEDHWLCESPLSTRSEGNDDVKFCEREGMKVSNIFIILQNNNVWWGLNCKCVILTSVNRREKQRRNRNLYIYTYTCT